MKDSKHREPKGLAVFVFYDAFLTDDLVLSVRLFTSSPNIQNIYFFINSFEYNTHCADPHSKNVMMSCKFFYIVLIKIIVLQINKCSLNEESILTT